MSSRLLRVVVHDPKWRIPTRLKKTNGEAYSTGKPSFDADEARAVDDALVPQVEDIASQNAVPVVGRVYWNTYNKTDSELGWRNYGIAYVTFKRVRSGDTCVHTGAEIISVESNHRRCDVDKCITWACVQTGVPTERGVWVQLPTHYSIPLLGALEDIAVHTVGHCSLIGRSTGIQYCLTKDGNLWATAVDDHGELVCTLGLHHPEWCGHVLSFASVVTCILRHHARYDYPEYTQLGTEMHHSEDQFCTIKHAWIQYCGGLESLAPLVYNRGHATWGHQRLRPALSNVADIHPTYALAWRLWHNKVASLEEIDRLEHRRITLEHRKSKSHGAGEDSPVSSDTAGRRDPTQTCCLKKTLQELGAWRWQVAGPRLSPSALKFVPSTYIQHWSGKVTPLPCALNGDLVLVRLNPEFEDTSKVGGGVPVRGMSSDAMAELIERSFTVAEAVVCSGKYSSVVYQGAPIPPELAL